MADWTNPDTAKWVYLNKRKPDIIDQGIIGHWLDLGEPEILAPNGWYNGFDPHIGLKPAGLHTEYDIHNMFNFFFIQGLYNGYQGIYDSGPLTQRPFMMARSGAPGIQRYGATNWSNDIGSNFSSLAT
jgi:alpha-glucosidase